MLKVPDEVVSAVVPRRMIPLAEGVARLGQAPRVARESGVLLVSNGVPTNSDRRSSVAVNG